MPDYPANWLRALEMLAGSTDGCTASLLSAHGLPTEVIAGLVDTGLVAVMTDRVLTGQRTVEVTRFRITDRGRAALNR
jgi:hypothetical protein